MLWLSVEVMVAIISTGIVRTKSVAGSQTVKKSYRSGFVKEKVCFNQYVYWLFQWYNSCIKCVGVSCLYICSCCRVNCAVRRLRMFNQFNPMAAFSKFWSCHPMTLPVAWDVSTMNYPGWSVTCFSGLRPNGLICLQSCSNTLYPVRLYYIRDALPASKRFLCWCQPQLACTVMCSPVKAHVGMRSFCSLGVYRRWERMCAC